jgi:DNA-binding response OmpR family regulator
VPDLDARTSRTRVLVIDDDEGLNALLAEYLGRFGFTVTAVTHPDDGLRALRSAPPDIVVLDLMLPGIDGFAVCRRIRETNRVPIMMLTARGDVTDRIVGLELGADDYLPKPFEPRELVARLQAVLRRADGAAPPEVLRAGGIEVQLTSRRVTLEGRELALTTAEFALLALLLRHRGRVLTRERILDETRGVDWDAYDRSVDVLVSRLRQKLGDDSRRPHFIRTVRGAGYCFAGGDE